MARRIESLASKSRAHFRHKQHPQHISGKASLPEQPRDGLLGDEEMLFTVGVMRFGHTLRVQQVRPILFKSSLSSPLPVNHLDRDDCQVYVSLPFL